MKDIKQYIMARDEYISLIKDELLGPGSEINIPDKEHELISTSPDKRYSIGILYTKYNKFKMDNDDPAGLENADEDVAELSVDLEDASPNAVEDIEIDVPAEEDNLDEEIGLATQNMPSSMGITFLVSRDVKTLFVDVKFATYLKAKSTDCRVPYYPNNPESYSVPEEVSNIAYYDKSEESLKLVRGGVSRKDISVLVEKDSFDDEYDLISSLYKLSDQLRSGHVRVPHSMCVAIDFSDKEFVDDNKELDGTKAKITALKRKINDNLFSITVMLVNDNEEDSNGLRCLFQPELKVDTTKNDFLFCCYSQLTDFEKLSEEEQSLELQYRNKHIYGSGLGTSVNWNIDDGGNGEIYNDFFPQAEVPAMDFSLPDKYAVSKEALSMKGLSDLIRTDKAQKLDLLDTVVRAYRKWIDELICEKVHIDGHFQNIAEKNIIGCSEACDRMFRGLSLLKSNDTAWIAFLLANRAMFMQRVHLLLQAKTSSKDRYPGDEELGNLLDSINYKEENDLTGNQFYWRPFQIAFLLMSIESIVSEDSSDRKLVDLIWFPTGGGKTEAYLGLTAFTIFYRRLMHDSNSDGTTVIMRYTLRLLAAQQFTRASTLICACEYIREDAVSRRPRYGRYNLGRKEINIGLWIGNEHIPNTNTNAKKHLKKLMDATASNLQYAKEQHNKFQVLKCPWCGTKMVKDRVGNKMIGSFGYRMRGNNHFEMFCPQESCYFNRRGTLPIQIIDEELYDNPPTLLFGTVDKFAMIPWKKEIGNFFAVNSETRVPELIIQDELHLISGPLGTMVGLYESIIDALCQRKGVMPKIVASTATIRRAKEQCAALYNRKVNQFPHPGLNAEDSFFARESKIDYANNKYGRIYVGLMPSGKSKAMMEIRSIASLLQKINTMDLSEDVKDKLWTLTVYFNSLRDLGKCSTLVEDDVKEYIRRSAYRLGSGKDVRNIGRADELTSRVTTTQLNETLDKLEKITYSKENINNKRFASNVLLATNMISVGIDVARLNVMLLISQPKLTSEYIQASSRVGRSYPGVAFTMYDSSKSRDRSHYEQFIPYHDSFYKFVEPTGATPFSKPARDRALHAIIIAIMRMIVPELLNEKDAGVFSRDLFDSQVSWIKQYIINRSEQITTRLNENMISDNEAISLEIESVFEKWEQLASNYPPGHFYYGSSFMFSNPEDGEGRLLKAFNTNIHDPAFDTMTSMRNVDSSVASNILIWEDE